MHDSIVIGIGGMGAATLYHLAKRGHKVLGIDQFGIAHDRGSSHGQTRIVRRAYFEHENYVPLLNDAYKLWDILQDETEQELKRICGMMIAGRSDGPINAGTRRSAELHGIPLEVNDANEALKKYPGFSFDDDMEILFDPGGGLLFVEECVSAHLTMAIQMGAEIKTNEPVLSWHSHGNSVTVKTATNSYNAQSLVITAGAWTSKLLKDLRLPLHIERVAYGWFPTENDAHRIDSGAPVFGIQSPNGFFYGFPQLDDRGVKVAEHAGNELVADPSNLTRDLTSGDLDAVQSFTRQYMPGIRQKHTHHSVCMYTMTPDKHFIVDLHPEYANVAFACGFSGHGFKFAPVIGSALADLVGKRVTTDSLDFLSLRRFLHS